VQQSLNMLINVPPLPCFPSCSALPATVRCVYNASVGYAVYAVCGFCEGRAQSRCRCGEGRAWEGGVHYLTEQRR